MMNFIKILLNYVSDIFFKKLLNIVLLIFDGIGIWMFFAPNTVVIFENNPLLAQKIGVLVFIISFVAANYISYKDMHEKLYLFNDRSILIGYVQSNFDYAEIINASDESLTRIEATIKYTNSQTNGNVVKPIDRFFQKTSESVWDSGQIVNILEKNQRIYIQFPAFDLILNGEILVTFQCESVKTSNRKKFQHQIKVMKNENNWYVL